MTSRKKEAPAPLPAVQGAKERQSNEGVQHSKSGAEAKDSPGTEQSAPLGGALAPDLDKAIDFLKQWHSDSEWHICHKHPDATDKRFPCRTFSAKSEDACRALIAAVQREGHNVYFNLNVWSTRNHKALDKNVVLIRGVAADLDPLKAADAAYSAQTRGELARLEPTFILDSGRGHWGIWQFEGDVEPSEEIRNFGRLLKEKLNAVPGRLYKADGVFDPSRVCRLPGTVNFPSTEKCSKNGAVPTLAIVGKGGTGRRIASLSSIPIDAIPVAVPASVPSPAQKGAVRPAIRRHSTREELDALVASLNVEQVKRNSIVLAITNPETLDDIDGAAREKDTSRSGRMFQALGRMVRAGMQEEDMLGLITDPAWPIVSAHVLDPTKNHGQPLRYAEKQIADAIKLARENGWVPASTNGSSAGAEAI